MTVDYAAILAAQQDLDPIVARITVGVRELLLAAGHTPILLGPTVEAPDACIGLTPYPLQDDLTGDVLMGLQVWIRGIKKAGAQAVIDRQEAILNILQQLVNVEIADGVTIVVCWRALSAPINLDSVGRPEVFDSYYLRTDRPAFV